MNIQDPIADMLTRIRNAQQVSKPDVSMPASKMKLAIARVLQEEGYILAYEQHNVDNKPVLTITLKYHKGKKVIDSLKRISKPSLRRYSAAAQMPEVMNGLGIAIVSTSKGIMTGRAAKRLGQGGEILCTIE